MNQSKQSIMTYLNELLVEMRQLIENPVEYKNAQLLLSREITKVWEDFKKSTGSSFNEQGNGEHMGINMMNMMSPISPISTIYSSSNMSYNQFVTPIKHQKPMVSTPKNHNGDDYGDSDDDSAYILQTKIFIPEAPKYLNGRAVKCNYVGRILGPSGMSARLIESQFNVSLLIRGKGSIRDKKKEQELIGKKGFEHLNEPLHVLLIARDADRKQCADYLERASQKIESLMTPVHDGLKKDQLLRLAVINGTYVQRSPMNDNSIGINNNNSMMY